MPEAPHVDHSVLVLAPIGRDGVLAQRVLAAADVRAIVCPNECEFRRLLGCGPGAAIVGDEAMTPDFVRAVVEILAEQPPWSDVPFVILTQGSVTSGQHRRSLDSFSELGNVTALERPVHASTLVSAAKAALRARERQHIMRAALEERERAVKQRDHFLALLGHELRNPLAAMASAGMLAQLHREESAKLVRPLGVIDRQIRHLTRLVDELLDVARITSGKITLQAVTTDLSSVVGAQVEEARPSADAAGLDLVSRLPVEPVLVTADPVRLAQIVSNLITNAIKYTPSGGSVEVSVDVAGEAVLRVADSGMGIANDVLARVFEPFTQAEHTLDRARGGMGLGLSVVRELTRLHGGEVLAESRGLGRGAVFTVRLPRCMTSTEAAALERPARTSSVQTVGRHVLVVEDGADNRELLSELLTMLGHRVDTAEDGQRGVELALELRPDVALVDIGLPVLDGYEVARRVRAKLGRGIQLVALTGYGQPEDRARSRAAGFDVHFTKPVNVERLRELLEAPESESAAVLAT